MDEKTPKPHKGKNKNKKKKNYRPPLPICCINIQTTDLKGFESFVQYIPKRQLFH